MLWTDDSGGSFGPSNQILRNRKRDVWYNSDEGRVYEKEIANLCKSQDD